MAISVIGHARERRTLEALRSSGSVPQAMIFTGPSGIGKKLIARAFLSALLCTGEKKPCGICPSCRQIASNAHPDMLVLETGETGSIPVGAADEPGSMRHLIARLSLKPAGERFCVLVDGIERASAEAQNAFLKTLEEPPAGSCIILVSSEKSGVLPTIMSRCREQRFSSLEPDEIGRIISEKEQSGGVVSLARSCANGSAGLALWLCDEVNRTAVLSLAAAIARGFSRGEDVSIPSSSAAKPKQGPDMIDVCINIFAYLAECKALDMTEYSPLLNDIYIDDMDALVSIIKILVSAKRGRANNLNAPLQLKAMVYAGSASAQ